MRKPVFFVLCLFGCNSGGDASTTASDASIGSLDSGGTTSTGGSSGGTSSGSTSNASADTSGTTTSEGPGTDGPIFDVGTNADVMVEMPKGPIIPTTCEEAEAGVSAVGCVFFGVDLDQNGGLEFDQYAIAVSNPQPGVDANVVVEQKVGGAWSEVASSTVSPLTLFAFQLADKHHQGSGVMEGGSYRVTSDVPIVAYQFNPLIQGAASSDASLLYPVTTWDSLNRAVHWGGGYGRGYLTVVAAYDDTTIEVIPTVATEAGTGVPAGSPGVPFEVTLQQGDIAEIMVTTENTALGGTRLESDSASKPIGVFSGHECAWIPHMIPACDHIEDQLSGVRLWGDHFVAARMPIRETNGIPETTLWHVVASEDDTTVTFTADPEVSGVPVGPQNIDAGGVIEFYAGGTAAHPGDFLVDADKPIALANYMTGEANLVTSTLGDPAMVQLSPIEQYLPRYILLVPSEWELDFFVVTRPNGAAVTIDGVAIDDTLFLPAGGGYEVARVPTTDGVHSLESSVGFMVTVVGYDSADSYAYIGGTGTGVINPNPEG
ncbi:MAG TPA: IgGFc-binding protein [Nannocystaceae bacterium]|nr:IgGFc-binding protein [Nannocystaceae bacterium]